MIVNKIELLEVRLPTSGMCSEWWEGCWLIRKGSQDWYVCEDGSYQGIHYIDSIPIEDRYQYLLTEQEGLF